MTPDNEALRAQFERLAKIEAAAQAFVAGAQRGFAHDEFLALRQALAAPAQECITPIRRHHHYPRPWREVLGFGPDWSGNSIAVNEAYRRLADRCHPDKGGTHAQMAELNRARVEALEAIK